MSTRHIRLFAVTSVPEGKAAVQRILGELEGLPDSESEEIELVGLAFNRRGAVQQMSRVQPDVLLVDLMLTGLRSIEIISEASAKLPDMKILALAPSDPPHDRVILALQAGATGYFTTDTEVRETATAIRQALKGKNYLPVDETFEIMRQAAPELLVSAKERRANLIDSLLALIPIVGIMSALTAFLWRKYWGGVGIRVSDLGVDASSRVTDLLMSMILLLGVFGPVLFIQSWLNIFHGWIEKKPGVRASLDKVLDSSFARSSIGQVLFGEWTAWFVVCFAVLSCTILLFVADAAMLNILIGIVVLVAVLVHVVRSSDILPNWLSLASDKIRETLVIIGCLILTLLMLLVLEVKQGADLRTDGVHGFLAPTVLGLSARPAIIYDLDEKRKPLSALYIGGNADLYVLYDPCDKVVRLVPVGSSRVKMIDEVKCASP